MKLDRRDSWLEGSGSVLSEYFFLAMILLTVNDTASIQSASGDYTCNFPFPDAISLTMRGIWSA